MEIIEQEIQKRGKVLPGNVLKVNSFLNHQLDPYLLNIMAGEWTKLFKNDNITKIVTIEASGIALAILTGLKLNVPVVFAKKQILKILVTSISRKFILIQETKILIFK